MHLVDHARMHIENTHIRPVMGPGDPSIALNRAPTTLYFPLGAYRRLVHKAIH